MLHVHDFSYVSYTCCARVPLRASRKILPPDLDPISSSSVSRIWLASRVYGIEHRLIEFEKENYTRGCPRQRRTEHGLFLRGSSLDLRGALHFQRVRVSLFLRRREARGSSEVNVRLIEEACRMVMLLPRKLMNPIY